LEGALLPSIAAEYGVEYRTAGAAEDERQFLGDAFYGFLLCLAGIYLTLAWVFASWVRPFVVMLVIPFGLIGAIWGHYWMGLSMSMFSIVGLIGMSGIIINDSIVLVTTIDEYAEKRGRIPSIIAGSADRLRAVVLTTLTTVGGLTPLMFEQSRQALFLKPTVVTLAFGLGFGVVLVLLVTPSVMAVEHDVRMALNSLRHAYKLRKKRYQQALRRRTRRRNANPPAETQTTGRFGPDRYAPHIPAHPSNRNEPFPDAAE
jgi:multidrug efflux pump subunit AcrB